MMHAGRGLRNSLVLGNIFRFACSKYKLTYSVANNLPPEILSYIFLLGVEQAEHDLDMAASRSKKRRSPRAIPFTLPVSQVCRRWRKIANAATLVSSYLPKICLLTCSQWTHIGFSDDRPHNL